MQYDVYDKRGNFHAAYDSTLDKVKKEPRYAEKCAVLTAKRVGAGARVIIHGTDQVVFTEA